MALEKLIQRLLFKEAGSALEYGVILLFFVLGCNMFIYFKTAGFSDIYLELGHRAFNAMEAHQKATLGGLFYGMLLIGFESIMYPYIGRKVKKGYRRLYWLVSIVLLIIGSMVAIHWGYNYIVVKEGMRVSRQMALEFIGSSLFFSFLVYCIFMSLAVSFIRQLRLNFGETVFLNYLYGRYSIPSVEERSFMFLDLNDSTTIAETLGHVKYSRFLNKCFDEILDAVDTYEFDVYQFVGDEIVFTWEVDRDAHGQAIVMYMALQRKLLLKKQEFIKLFGVSPVFKAGVSSGNVTSTVVGKKKRAIAYHGDVLNTAARLLGLCKPLNSSLLFTDFYLEHLRSPFLFSPKFLVEMKLRGKNNCSRIYAPENLMAP